jgi:probable F420-dependent oxidoreductase
MIDVGLTLPNYRGGATPEYIFATAERSDALGFHSLWVADHIAIPDSYKNTMGPVLYETHTTLAVIAGRTRQIRLGFSVMPTPYRHPLFQAKSLATLDQLSSGRVIYGGAVGYMVDEFHALGIDFRQRIAMTDEYLEVLKLAWTEEVITFHGKFVDCVDMRSEPKPYQQPHPPIWLGGDSDGLFRMVVRRADGWHGLFGGTPGGRREDPTIAHFGARIGRLHEIAEAAGRDPASIALSIKANCTIGPDGPHPFQGSPSKIVESILQLADLGLELVVLSPNLGTTVMPLEMLDQIAEEIMVPVKNARAQAPAR